ncbi:MAG: hypothetical protein MJ223_02865 [Mycoplasmoidaceae bacterium]|nr:hypothetical protein [Mycoplasmoidaceae bacterium]
MSRIKFISTIAAMIIIPQAICSMSSCSSKPEPTPPKKEYHVTCDKQDLTLHHNDLTKKDTFTIKSEDFFIDYPDGLV